jgi:ribonuclease PH
VHDSLTKEAILKQGSIFGWDFEKLENSIRNALETRRLRTEIARTQEIQRLIGRSLRP